MVLELDKGNSCTSLFSSHSFLSGAEQVDQTHVLPFHKQKRISICCNFPEFISKSVSFIKQLFQYQLPNKFEIQLPQVE